MCQVCVECRVSGRFRVCVGVSRARYTHTHTHTHSLTRARTHTHKHTHTLTHTHSLSLSLSLSHTHTHTHTQVVISRALFLFLLHNHFITEKFYKKKSGDVNDEANFSLFFCFKRELNPYSPLTYSLTLRARTQTLYSAPPSLSLSIRERRLESSTL